MALPSRESLGQTRSPFESGNLRNRRGAHQRGFARATLVRLHLGLREVAGRATGFTDIPNAAASGLNPSDSVSRGHAPKIGGRK